MCLIIAIFFLSLSFLPSTHDSLRRICLFYLPTILVGPDLAPLIMYILYKLWASWWTVVTHGLHLSSCRPDSVWIAHHQGGPCLVLSSARFPHVSITSKTLSRIRAYAPRPEPVVARGPAVASTFAACCWELSCMVQLQLALSARGFGRLGV